MLFAEHVCDSCHSKPSCYVLSFGGVLFTFHSFSSASAYGYQHPARYNGLLAVAASNVYNASLRNNVSISAI
jgi:hypothetical protein